MYGTSFCSIGGFFALVLDSVWTVNSWTWTSDSPRGSEFVCQMFVFLCSSLRRPTSIKWMNQQQHYSQLLWHEFICSKKTCTRIACKVHLLYSLMFSWRESWWTNEPLWWTQWDHQTRLMLRFTSCGPGIARSLWMLQGFHQNIFKQYWVITVKWLKCLIHHDLFQVYKNTQRK